MKTCSCPDYKFKILKCKHIIATEIAGYTYNNKWTYVLLDCIILSPNILTTTGQPYLVYLTYSPIS